MLDDRQQPLARVVAAGERQGLDRAAQRGQRVLQLVRHVRGEALDGVDAVVERLRHVAQRARQVADLVGAAGEVGDLLARLRAPAHPLGRLRQAADRAGDGAGEEQRQDDHDHGRHQEDLQQGEALGGDDGVDVAFLGREQERALDRAEALDRHRHRDDGLAPVVDAHHARLLAGKGLLHFRQGLAVGGAGLLEHRALGAPEHLADAVPGPLHHAGRVFHVRDRRQLHAQDVAAGIERPGIEQQQAVPVEDPGAGLGRRHQAAQQGRDPLGVDREFERREGFVGEPFRFAGLHLQQLVRIDGDGVGLDRRRACDGARDDLALGEKALYAGFDEALAELVEVEEADEERDEAGEVEHDDAARQARRAALDDHAAEMLQPRQERSGEPAGRRMPRRRGWAQPSCRSFTHGPMRGTGPWQSFQVACAFKSVRLP